MFTALYNLFILKNGPPCSSTTLKIFIHGLCFVRGGMNDNWWDLIADPNPIQSNINNAKAKEKRPQLNGTPTGTRITCA
jgi:hypothetical protein